jgi:hypothetical protein
VIPVCVQHCQAQNQRGIGVLILSNPTRTDSARLPSFKLLLPISWTFVSEAKCTLSWCQACWRDKLQVIQVIDLFVQSSHRANQEANEVTKIIEKRHTKPLPNGAIGSPFTEEGRGELSTAWADTCTYVGMYVLG